MGEIEAVNHEDKPKDIIIPITYNNEFTALGMVSYSKEPSINPNNEVLKQMIITNFKKNTQ